MRHGQLTVWLGVVAAALAAGAEVVEIHPGNGVTTNVTERFTGDTVLSINKGTKLDFGAGAEEPHYGDQIALASVTGTCTFPPRMQVLNGGRVRTVKLSLVDGILWATPTSGGTQILVR